MSGGLIIALLFEAANKIRTRKCVNNISDALPLKDAIVTLKCFGALFRLAAATFASSRMAKCGSVCRMQRLATKQNA